METTNPTPPKKTGRPRKYEGGNPELEQFTPRQLIEELRARGYRGELTYTQRVKV